MIEKFYAQYHRRQHKKGNTGGNELDREVFILF